MFSGGDGLIDMLEYPEPGPPHFLGIVVAGLVVSGQRSGEGSDREDLLRRWRAHRRDEDGDAHRHYEGRCWRPLDRAGDRREDAARRDPAPRVADEPARRLPVRNLG